MLRKVLLVCGIIAPVLYVGTDILASTLYRGYSYTAQQVSELSAIGAPTRPLWLAMSNVYAPLMVAFGVGVFLSAGAKRSLRVAGGLVIASPIIGRLWPPMNQRGNIGSTTDTLHVVFAGVVVFLIVLSIAFGSGASGRGFRVYSIATILAMLVAGAIVSAVAVPAMAAGEPTPWMGLVERVSVYAPMAWFVALALVLLSAPSTVPNDRDWRWT